MDELIKAMDIKGLEAFKSMYKGNEAIAKIVDGYIEVKRKEELQAKAKEQFVSTIDKMIAKLPHPEDIANVYMAWREVELPDGEPETVEVTGADGKKTTETRQPTKKMFKWVVEVNKGFVVGKASTTSQQTSVKRAITIYKRDGTQLALVGNFKTGSEAANHVKLSVGASSANLVLRNAGYIIEPYTGTDFTVKS